MKVFIFTIYDSKAETFNAPFFMTNEPQAVRGFSDAVNNPETPYGKHPEDYTLFLIGEYDDTTAEIITIAPKSIGVGVIFVNPSD